MASSIKEPYVSLKEIIVNTPSVSDIDDSSILAGVVNAQCGPDHAFVQGPKQFLKEFTLDGELPSDADVTLVNAYFCSFFAPMLIKRAWTANAGKVPVLKSTFVASPTLSKVDVDVENLPYESADNNGVSLKYPVDLVTTASGTEIASKLVVGITTPDYWDDNLATKFGASPYGFDATADQISQDEWESYLVVYWFQYGGSDDPYAYAENEETAGWRLVSLRSDGTNPQTGEAIYWEDIMDDDRIPFNVNFKTSAQPATLTEVKMFQTTGVTAANYNQSNPSLNDYKAGFDWISEQTDVYNISYISAFGCKWSGIEKTISGYADVLKWFYACDCPVDKTTLSAVETWANGLGIAETYRTILMGPFDKSSAVTRQKYPIAASSLYWQKVYSNKASNSEFAPCFDITNGVLSVSKLYKEFNKSQREELLNQTYPINWIKFDRTNNCYYLNNNLTHTRKKNVMNEEMNVRMINKIQRDILLLLPRYKGLLNNEETRLDVYGLIDDYFKNSIMTQNYRPVEYLIICDETNNTDAVVNANKLAVTVYVRLQNSIKYIEVINKVFPLGVDFES